MSQHLLTYPTVQEGVRKFQDTSVGKMSMQLSNSAYEMVAGPLLSYFDKPYQYVSPYVERVDDFGDQTLTRMEERFPVVKKPSPEVLEEARKVVYAPATHINNIYQVVYQKTPGGSIAHGKAAVKTAAVVTAQGLLIGVQKVHESLDAAVKSVNDAVAANSANANGQESSPEGQGQSQNEPEPKSVSA